MSVFSQTFLHETFGGKPSVFLAAFGKHPGWNDHLDDFGFETESLAQAKQLIYLQGLARQIDSAAWDELPEEKRLPGFNHVFLWLRGNAFIAGSLWSSQDGKGRSKYPMAVAVQGTNLPAAWAVATVFPALDELKAKCQVAATAEAVIQALTETRRSLRERLSQPPGPAVLEQLVALPKTETRTSLHRVLYEISNHMKAFAPGSADGKSGGEAASRRLRVTADPCDPVVLTQWMRLTARQLEDDVPVFGVAARDAGLIDLIVGEPAATDFFCLRASARQLPPTPDIPYTLEPPFVDAAEQVVRGFTEPQEPSLTIFGPRRRSGFTLFPWSTATAKEPRGASPRRSEATEIAAPPPLPHAPADPSLRWVKVVFILLGLAITALTFYFATRKS